MVKSEFVTEVTEGSKDGTWVVVFLHEDSVMDSRILEEMLPAVARSCPATKFLQIVASQCIEGYPERNVPTLLIYHDGELDCQVVGLAKLGGRDTKPESASVWPCVVFECGTHVPFIRPSPFIRSPPFALVSPWQSSNGFCQSLERWKRSSPKTRAPKPKAS